MTNLRGFGEKSWVLGLDLLENLKEHGQEGGPDQLDSMRSFPSRFLHSTLYLRWQYLVIWKSPLSLQNAMPEDESTLDTEYFQ